MKALDQEYPDLPGTEKFPPIPRELFKTKSQRCSDHDSSGPSSSSGSGSKYTNRLYLESSPYLQQHAHNPVNWFPWGREAFDIAQQLDRPLLVSIGYSTCHWCHVMEEESFESEDLARILNGNFIPVKVDREERPDLDSLYMSAVHAMGIQGGWPLNVFLTPDGKPFYGGTYFPLHDHSGGIGFLSLLKRLVEAYSQNREHINRAGNRLTELLQEQLTTKPSQELPETALLAEAVEAFRQGFDPVNGGLIRAPKFPSSLPVRLLFRNYLRSEDLDLLAMADLSLQKMANGGIYDHIGGGFHRYATDDAWLTPHFEKMLYDNAQLAVVYLEGYQVLGRQEFATIASDILKYLQKEMKSPEGGFYSGTDADSMAENGNMEEGFFFTWAYSELVEVLDARALVFVEKFYGVTKEGNFDGRNILHPKSKIAEVARQLALREPEPESLLREVKKVLYQTRKRRTPPFVDKKILVGWNGLAISAFVRAGFVLNDPSAIDQARDTAGLLIEKTVHNGILAHSYQEKEAKGRAFLEDYALLIAGLVDLFEVTGERLWLERSLVLTQTVQKEFKDPATGGFFLTGTRHEKLIAKEKPSYDGVIPSGNSVMIMNLLRLHGLTEAQAYLEEAQRGLRAFATQLSSTPTAHTEMLMALDFFANPPLQLAVIYPQGERIAAEPLLETIRKTYLPNRILAVVSEGEQLDRASELVPFLKGKKADRGHAVAYACQNKRCHLPTTDPATLRKILEGSSQASL